MGKDCLLVTLVLADQVDTQLCHGQVGFAVAFMDGHGFGLHDGQHVITFLEPQQALAHAVQGPEQVGAGRPGMHQQLEILFQGHLPVTTGGQALTNRQGQAIGGADANGRRTAHHHRTNGLGHCGGIAAGQPDLRARQRALVEQIKGAIPPIDGFHLLCSH
ncbi:hypothetical protein D3C80_862650 [compost metagenome]